MTKVKIIDILALVFREKGTVIYKFTKSVKNMKIFVDTGFNKWYITDHNESGGEGGGCHLSGHIGRSHIHKIFQHQQGDEKCDYKSYDLEDRSFLHENLSKTQHLCLPKYSVFTPCTQTPAIPDIRQAGAFHPFAERIYTSSVTIGVLAAFSV